MRDRRAFMLYLVLILTTLIGILAFSLQFYARTVNRLAHRMSRGDVAENLARSGLTIALARLNQALPWQGKLVLTLDTGQESPWMFFLTRTPDQINADLGGGERDLGALFDRFLAPEWRDALTALEEQVPGSRVELFADVDARPLAPGLSWNDPVEKIVRFSLSARARWQEVQRTLRTGIEIKVTSPIAPLVGGFTLYALRTSGDFNRVTSDESGYPTGTELPLVLDNTPAAEVAAGRDDASLMARRALADETRQALGNRGRVRLGGDPVLLHLASGLQGIGQFQQIYDPARFPDAHLLAHVFAPPPFFNRYDGRRTTRERGHPSPDGSFVQYPHLTNIYLGFHEALRDDPLLEGAPILEGRSSLLHLYGSPGSPSRAFVHGDVREGMVKITRIGIESVAVDGSGARTVPDQTFGDVPYMPYVPSEADWQDDLIREEAGQVPRYLAAIAREFGPARSPPLPPAFTLDPARYRHRDMFGDRYEVPSSDTVTYARLMSRVEVFPYNDAIDAMRSPGSYPVSIARQSQPGFGTALEGPPESYVAFERHVRSWSDPLHARLGNPTAFEGDPDAFVAGGDAPELEAILRARAVREVSDVDELLARYLDASSATLRVHGTVLVHGGDARLPLLAAGGAGTVVVTSGDLVLDGVLAPEPVPGVVGPHLTLVTLTGNLRLKAGRTYAAQLAAPRGRMVVEGDGGLDLRGSLTLGSLEPSDLPRGGRLRFAGHLDAGQPHDPGWAHYIDYYQIRMAALPLAVERAP